MAKNLADKLVPPLSPERLDRQWRGIVARTEGAWWSRLGFARVRPAYAALSFAAVAALALVVAFGRPRAPSVVEGGSFSNVGAGSATMALLDGSQLQVSPSGRVEFKALSTQAVRLVLTRGWVELDVTHLPGREFVVQAGSVDVVVRGTHFRVELSDADPQVVAVAVKHGRVEVRDRRSGAVTKQLEAGTSWTMGQREAAPPAPAPTEASAAAAPVSESPVAPVNPAPAAAVESDRFDELYKARKLQQAYDSLGDSGFARALEASSPKRLLELADAARLSGHPRQAASALDGLRKRYRSDARAGLAALELGRLRLDTFHDPAGALEAFKEAQSLSRSGSVQEDALARQAQALEALGNSAGCQRVKAEYLQRYPSGIHSASIARRCGGP